MNARKRRKRWRLRLSVVWVLGILIAGVGINAYLALRPSSLRIAVLRQLEMALESPVAVASCRFGLTRGVEVEGLRIGGLEEALDRPVLEAAHVRIWPDFFALLSGVFRADSIVVDSPVVRLRRRSDGVWNLEGLLAKRDTSGAAPEIPSLQLRGGTVIFEDEATFQEPVSAELRNVDLDLRLKSDGVCDFVVRGEFDGIRRLQVEGSTRRVEGGVKGTARLRAVKVDVAADWTRFLPGDLVEMVRRASPRGLADLDVEVSIDPVRGVQPGRVEGRLLGCAFTLPGLPLDVRDLQATVVVRDDKITLRDLEGRFADGVLSGSADLQTKPGGGFTRFTAGLKVDGLSLEGRARELVPVAHRHWVDKFPAAGKVDLLLRVSEVEEFPPAAEDLELTVRLQGVELKLADLPYRLQDLRGDLEISSSNLKIPGVVRAQLGRTRVEISGAGIDFAPHGAVDVNLALEDFPLDDKARSLLPEPGRPVLDSFHVMGSADGNIHLWRERPGEDGETEPEPVRVVVNGTSRNARMSYKHFPYELKDISGRVAFDSETHELTFVDIKGVHGDQTVFGEGTVKFGKPTELRIDLSAEALEVEDDLVAALPEKAQKLLHDFGLEGRVDTKVTIQSTVPSGVEVITEVTVVEGRVRPSEFPYPLELAGGTMRFFGAHTMTFEDVRTPEGFKPAVVFNGTLATANAERRLGFGFEIHDLPVDDTLLNALAPELRQFAKDFGLEGVFHGELEGHYSFREGDPGASKIIYWGKNIRTTDAAVNFGLQVREIKGTGDFVGRKEPGTDHFFFGEVDVSSALFNRLRLTNGEIQFAYGREHETIAAAREGKLGPTDYAPPDWIVGRLQESRVKNTFQMMAHSSDLYGGRVDGFGYVDTGELHDLGGHVVGKGLELGRAAQDIFGVDGTGTEGKGGGEVTFRGRTGDLDSLSGEGKGAIVEAKLIALPLFFRILSKLFGEGAGAHHFNQVNLDFKIRDQKFATVPNGLELRSQVLKLQGGGSMDFQGNLAWRLRPAFFLVRIPLVDDLLDVFKKGLFEVVVKGSLDDPKVAIATAGGTIEFDVESGAEEAKPNLPQDLRERAARGGEE